MALDEALLISCHQGKSPPVLRLYQWEPSGVSIGYFQKINQAVDVDKCKQANIGVVRRLTGGRAVLHLEDLTYSVCASEDFFDQLGASVAQTYQKICFAFLEAFGLLNLNAEWVKVSKSFSDTPLADEKNNGWLYSHPCFSSGSRYEIEIQGKKILGSAQRRFLATLSGQKGGKESFLQHGSLPLTRGEIDLVDLLPAYQKADPQTKSKFRDSYITLEEATNRNIPLQELLTSVQKGFERFFSIEFEDNVLSPEEEKLVGRLLQEKYITKEWNFKR